MPMLQLSGLLVCECKTEGFNQSIINQITRMHSSGMRTARLLTVFQRALRRGVSVWGLSASWVCQGVSTWGVSAWEVSARGMSGQGVSGWVVSASGLGGVCLWSQGDCVSQHAMGQTPPCGQTDTCENITFANFDCG